MKATQTIRHQQLAKFKETTKRFTNRDKHYVTCYNDPTHIWEIYLNGYEAPTEDHAEGKALRRDISQHNMMLMEKNNFANDIIDYITNDLEYPNYKIVRETKIIVSKEPICKHTRVDPITGTIFYCHDKAKITHKKWKDELTCTKHNNSTLLHRLVE